MVGMGGWIYSIILVWRVKTVLRVIIGLNRSFQLCKLTFPFWNCKERKKRVAV